MPDYPWDKAARENIAEALTRMCSSQEEVEYIVRRALALHRSWKHCAIPGLRQALVSRFHSRDGIESGAECTSDAYPDGIPGETGPDRWQIEAALMKALPPGEVPTNDERLQIAVAELADKKRMAPGDRCADECARKLAQMGL